MDCEILPLWQEIVPFSYVDLTANLSSGEDEVQNQTSKQQLQKNKF